MLTLNLKEGGQIDLPGMAILLLEEAPDGKGCHIVHNLMPEQNALEELTDKYGFVKKNWLEEVPYMAPSMLEVTLTPPDGNTRKLLVHCDCVVGRRDLIGAPNGAKTRLTLNVNKAVFNVDVADSRESLTGEENDN